MKRIAIISGLLALMFLLSGCYTLVRPPLTAIQADSSAVVQYYQDRSYTDNSTDVYVYNGNYYPRNPYRWHMRYDWFSDNYYYDPYYYDSRYYYDDRYYWNNRYYWYNDGFWYYYPTSPGGSSGSSGGGTKTEGPRNLSVPRAIGPAAGISSGSPAAPALGGDASKRYAPPSSTASSAPATVGKSSISSGESKRYSAPKSSGSSGSSSKAESSESKTENSKQTRSKKPKR